VRQLVVFLSMLSVSRGVGAQPASTADVKAPPQAAVASARATPPGPTVRPLYLALEKSLSARRPADIAVGPGQFFYVLERRGDLLAFDRNALSIAKRASIRTPIAMSLDPRSGNILVLGTSGKRGPWQTVYSVDPETFTAKLLYELQENYAMNEHGAGFVADGAGRLIVNNRNTLDKPALAVIGQASGTVEGRVTVREEGLLGPKALPDLVRAFMNANRLRRLGSEVYALNTTTGRVTVFHLPEMKEISSFQVPREQDWQEPSILEDGGVAVNYAAFDLAFAKNGSVYVLANVGRPLGYVVERGQVTRSLQFAPETPSSDLASNYDSIAIFDDGRVLLGSSPDNRVDVFSVQEK
jgi:hypothetical protein